MRISSSGPVGQTTDTPHGQAPRSPASGQPTAVNQMTQPQVATLPNSAARGRTQLKRISVNTTPEEVTYPRDADMEKLYALPPDACRMHARHLIENHTGLKPDFARMSTARAKVFLEELGNNTSGHLRNIRLLPGTIAVPMSDFAHALEKLGAQHPGSKVDLNFCGRKLSEDEGKVFADVLAKSTVSTLLLDTPPSGQPDGARQVLELVPQSRVRQLEVLGRGVDSCAAALAKAASRLDKLEVSSLGVTDEAKSKIDGACWDAGKTNIIRWHNAADELNNSNAEIAKQAVLQESPEKFKTAVHDFVQQSRNVKVDLWAIGQVSGMHAPAKQEALLEQLSASNVTGLRIVGIQLWELEKIPDNTAHALVQMSRNNPALRMALVFNETILGAQGAEVVAATLRESKVASLSLDSTGLTAAGTAKVAQAVPDSRLEVLDMCNNEFNDEGVNALVSALPTLRSLTLTASNFTEQQRKKLHEVETACVINWE